MKSASHRAAQPSPGKPERDLASIQGDLFQCLETEAQPPTDLDLQHELLGAITHSIRDARSRGIGRERIVDAMNALLPDLDKPLTLRQLNSWTALSKEYSEFPARYLPAFCVATGSDLPLRVLAQSIHRDLVDAREALAKRLGETQIERARLSREERAIKRQLGDHE
jgi:hypothetical protein